MDPGTDELRDAHDVLAEIYVDRLANLLAELPADRAVLGLFADLVRAADLGSTVGDVGCGTGRLAPFLAERGFSLHGVDLSPEMIRIARRDHPDHPFHVGDVRALPFPTGSLAGAVAWYSLMYLQPQERPRAFAELARVLKPGGLVAAAFKVGDNSHRRAGAQLDLGIEFDIYWLSHDEFRRHFSDSGFRIVFSAERPAGPEEGQPQGYLIAERL